MTRALAVVAFVLVGCGDEGRECGRGTRVGDDGTCVADGSCGLGTVFDPETETCVVDEAVCAGDLVYIPGKGCVDASDELVADLTEGVEPNGFDVVEASNTPAGMITLKGLDQPFVIKGAIEPFRDANGNGEIDPDLDTYLVSVTAPTLLEISVEGIAGLAGAFVALAGTGNPATGWRRFGIGVTGDRARRLVWLPAPGAYKLAIGDTRSMLLDASSPPAAGAGAATTGRYVATVTLKAPPTPTPLTLVNKVATHPGMLAVGEVQYVTVAMGTGLNTIVLDMPGTPGASVVVGKNNSYLAHADERFAPPMPARLQQGGFVAADQSLVVVDATFHYGPGPTGFTLTVTTAP